MKLQKLKTMILPSSFKRSLKYTKMKTNQKLINIKLWLRQCQMLKKTLRKLNKNNKKKPSTVHLIYLFLERPHQLSQFLM